MTLDNVLILSGLQFPHPGGSNITTLQNYHEYKTKQYIKALEKPGIGSSQQILEKHHYFDI